MASCLLIARGAVDLSCKEQAADQFRFKGRLQLRRVEIVIFYSVARSVDFSVAQSRDLVQRVELHIHGHGRRESVKIHLVRILALGLQEERVLLPVRKRRELCLYRRTVARSRALDLSVVEWGVGNGSHQRGMHLGVGVACPAGQLLQRPSLAHETEPVEIVLAVLPFHVFKMDRAAVYAHRRARLHALGRYAVTCDALREVVHGRLGTPSALHLATPHMHQSVEKRSRRNDGASGVKLHAPHRLHARGDTVLHDNLVGLVLPHVKVGCVVQNCAPLPYKLSAVTLCSWAPHRRSFASVEHAKLNGCGIGHEAHLSSQRIDLAHYLSFGNSAHGGVAAHLSNLVHVHSDEARFSAHVGGCRSGLTACVSTSYDNDVVKEIHYAIFIFGKIKNKN